MLAAKYVLLTRLPLKSPSISCNHRKSIQIKRLTIRVAKKLFLDSVHWKYFFLVQMLEFVAFESQISQLRMQPVECVYFITLHDFSISVLMYNRDVRHGIDTACFPLKLKSV